MTSSSTMNFQSYLEDTYRIIKEQPLILILGGLLAQLLTILSMGILAGPFLGGYILLIICYLRDDRKPTFNDLFSGLQQFGRLFPYFLVLLFIFIGFMLLVLPGLLFATWWLYVLPLMVDRHMTFSEAMRVSMNKVNENGFFMHFVFLLLISVIPIMLLNIISGLLPPLFVLKILLPPFQAGCLASLYIDQFGTEETEETMKTGPVPAAESEIDRTAQEDVTLIGSGEEESHADPVESGGDAGFDSDAEDSTDDSEEAGTDEKPDKSDRQQNGSSSKDSGK